MGRETGGRGWGSPGARMRIDSDVGERGGRGAIIEQPQRLAPALLPLQREGRGGGLASQLLAHDRERELQVPSPHRSTARKSSEIYSPPGCPIDTGACGYNRPCAHQICR